MKNHYVIGASASPSWTVSRYKELAKSLAKSSSFPFVVVTIHWNGEGAQPWGFATRAEASARYDGVAEQPDGVAYVAVFDKSATDGEPYDEGFFVASAVFDRTTTKTMASTAGWVAAFAAGLLGVMAFKRKKRGV